MLVKSILPISFDIWWYPTCYVLFLVVEPFVYSGLKELGRIRHISLCVSILAVYGGMAFIPGSYDLTYTPIFCVSIYILMAAYKWYIRPVPSEVLCAMVFMGYLLGLPYYVLAYIKGTVGYYALNVGLSIPTLSIGLGTFLLFQRMHFRSVLINRLAACSFGVYLISDHPVVRDILWRKLLTLDIVSSWGPLLLTSLCILVVLYLALSAIDALRQCLFAITIDRRKGWLFDCAWDLTVERRIKPGLNAFLVKYGRDA